MREESEAGLRDVNPAIVFLRNMQLEHLYTIGEHGALEYLIFPNFKRITPTKHKISMKEYVIFS